MAAPENLLDIILSPIYVLCILFAFYIKMFSYKIIFNEQWAIEIGTWVMHTILLGKEKFFRRVYIDGVGIYI